MRVVSERLMAAVVAGMLLASPLAVQAATPSTIGSQATHASESVDKNSPEQVVRGTTDALLGVIKDKRSLFKSDPDAFLQALEQVLNQNVVDFDYLSRGVMGRYSRLSNPEQMQKFQHEFKQSLLNFYGKALVAYDNEKITVLPVDKNQLKQRSVPVRMEIETANGTTYPLIYTMAKVDGQWKVRNVTVNGINIGKLFRTQFQQAMQTYSSANSRTQLGATENAAKADTGEEGTLAFVVNNWSKIIKPADVEQK